MSMASTFSDIPEELLLKIFLLQPMNSLVLLRNVCKLWDQIISSEHFNKLLLARERTSSNTNKYLLLEGARVSRSISLVDSEMQMYHDLPIKNYECYGICDGLLCLSSKGFSKQHSTIILWNPIFRKILPPLKIKSSELTYMCFGHHDGDYKVIKVVVFPRMYNVCIYSLSTDSWKIREFDGTISRNYNYNYKLGSCRSSLHDSKGRLLNGMAYFVDYSGRYNHGIIFFDLSLEMFQELPVRHLIDSDFIMEEFKESLALIEIDLNNYYGKIESVVMQVLRESNDSVSLDGMQLVRGFRRDVQFKPVGFINKDEVVIRITKLNPIPTYSFFLWNVEDQLQRQITNPGLCSPVVQSGDFKTELCASIPIVQSSDLKSFFGLGVNARTSSSVELGKYIKPICPPSRRPTRQPRKKEVASTSNSYAALADSGDDRSDED